MPDKPNKPQKLKARLPRGLQDRGAGEIAATRRMLETISRRYELYGFEPVETPAIEFTDALGKFLPDQDRPNEGVFSFQDDDEQWLSLRYDLTAPLARYFAQNYLSLPQPYRSYRYGWVFRNEKPGPGRFRQFMQFDADTIGSASPAADAEMCMLAADTFRALGFKVGQYVVKVSNRKLFDGLLDHVGLGGEENLAKRLTVLRAADKLDRLGLVAVAELLQNGRTDESGDFTKGAGLTRNQANEILGFLATGAGIPYEEFMRSIQGDIDYKNSVASFGRNLKTSVVANHRALAALETAYGSNRIFAEGIAELRAIADLLMAGRFRENRIRIDPSVVRGLEYYTGPVYEVELLLDTKDDKGQPVRFGSVGGGGRYDGMVSRFMGQSVPATGFSIGVSRLAAALTLIGKVRARPASGPVLVTVMDHSRLADYQKLVQTLRSNKIPAELYLGSKNHKIDQQLKYAGRRHAPCAVIQGSFEKDDPEGPKVVVKDLARGAALATEAGRAEHLQKQTQAQQTVPEGKLVETVRAILARHKAD